MSDATTNAVKAGVYTALWTFIAIFGLSLIGWLNDIVGWATNDGAVISFPDATVLVKAAAAAAAAAASGIVGTVIRLAQIALGAGTVPQYSNKHTL